MNEVLRWDFPLPRTHTGMLQGNGTLGAMIWGQENVLKVTLNRGDFWDHRGGIIWSEEINYKDIRSHLQHGDYTKLKALFEPKDTASGQVFSPSLLPLGRFELVLPKETSVKAGYLHLKNGKIVIDIGSGQNSSYQLSLHMAMDKPLINIRLSPGKEPPQINPVSAYDLTGKSLEKRSFEKPDLFDESPFFGWIQKRPVDPPVCVAYLVTETDIWATVVYGKDSQECKKNAQAILQEAQSQGGDTFRAACAQWWAEYWKRVPQIEIPNDSLSFLYSYGIYKFAGLTNPTGIPAGLQGPWIEEYQMPPWSADYHFNINIQMCYWPAYRTNLMEHLLPLFSMIDSWKEILKENARKFIGIDDGLMMPHAVDDRCVGMGGFWTGAIDHGCTAWVAEMMYRYFLYTQDNEFLKNTAYPFMVGTMRVYEEMLDREGEHFALAVSVSPEYRGSADNAWGKNSSFQLACIHFLCENLQSAARVLGLEPKAIWDEIRQKLPLAGLCSNNNHDEPQIGIWEDVPLEESHRHHSHLAAICPFDTIDLEDPEWRPILEKTIINWIGNGMGKWSGWCVPWASMIHTRFRNGETAELLLEMWQKLFTNEGHGTLHDPHFPGFSILGSGATKMAKGEIMQMDAGMAATAAVLEMLLHTRKGVNYLFWGVPNSWKQVSFENIRTEGAFEVSAVRRAQRVVKVSVKANNQGVFKLANPWNGRVNVQRQQGNTVIDGAVLEIEMTQGERIALSGE